MSPYLEIVAGFDVGKRIAIGAEPITIGRSPANRFCLPDSRASRQHAQVRSDAGQVVIEDLNSANGTFVNEQRLEPGKPYVLQPGDEIAISTTRIRFCAEAQTAAVLRTGEDSLLSVVMVGEDQAQQPQEVNLTLDASRSMMDLREEEKQSLRGMQEAVKRLQAMVKISGELGAVTRQEAILQRIMDNIFAVFPHADRAFIMLRDKRSGEMKPIAARYRQAKAGAKEEFAVSRTILNTVVKLRQSVLSSDAQRDQRFGLQQSIVALSIRSMMCAPFICQDEILGVINVDTVSGSRAFSADDLAMLTGLAAQAAIALKNAELYEEVKGETQKRTHLSRYMS
ncbi:MAG: FHA domain-containing protein, partial [Planctomycetota bacterium]|nr:FHA domain-containing protein [Planctomycetota bacterium]